MNQLTTFQLNTSEAEYAKDPKVKKEDIAEIIRWIQKQPHMPDVTEYVTIQFYHACNYSLHRTKILLDLFYKYKHEAPELFTGGIFEPPRYQWNFWDIVYHFDVSSVDGSRLIYAGLKDYDAAKYSFESMVPLFMKVTLTTLMEQGTCCGYSVIFDARGFSARHLATVNITIARKLLFFVQEVMPVTIRSVRIIHVHPVINRLFLLLRPFIKKELFDKIYLHSDLNEFFEAVGKEHVPINLGGTLASTTDELNDIMKMKFNALSEDVDEELRKRTDESKRMGEGQGNFVDINGSFRTLEVD